jgi:hypothetical protein
MGLSNVHYEPPELWKKYGLHKSNMVDQFWHKSKDWEADLKLYYDYVEVCHDQVSWYLEKFPEERSRYFSRELGYYDIVKRIPAAMDAMNQACDILKKYNLIVEKE